ncbi:MAG: hypothetical protein KBF98_05255 [Rhodoferax sp.]|nr:hypothetical protein [Rhodoferax sp.]
MLLVAKNQKKHLLLPRLLLLPLKPLLLLLPQLLMLPLQHLLLMLLLLQPALLLMQPVLLLLLQASKHYLFPLVKKPPSGGFFFGIFKHIVFTSSQLSTRSKHFVDANKMAAYRAETAMAIFLSETDRRHAFAYPFCQITKTSQKA